MKYISICTQFQLTVDSAKAIAQYFMNDSFFYCHMSILLEFFQQQQQQKNFNKRNIKQNVP